MFSFINICCYLDGMCQKYEAKPTQIYQLQILSQGYLQTSSTGQKRDNKQRQGWRDPVGPKPQGWDLVRGGDVGWRADTPGVSWMRSEGDWWGELDCPCAQTRVLGVWWCSPRTWLTALCTPYCWNFLCWMCWGDSKSVLLFGFLHRSCGSGWVAPQSGILDFWKGGLRGIDQKKYTIEVKTVKARKSDRVVIKHGKSATICHQTLIFCNSS